MTLASLKPPTPLHELAARVGSLGGVLLSGSTASSLQAASFCDDFETLILNSPVFRAAVEQQHRKNPESVGAELWPGVRLSRLLPQETPTLWYLVTFSLPLLASEQLRAICDRAKHDYRATVARADVSRLLAPAEACRVEQAVQWLASDHSADSAQRQGLRSLGNELGNAYEELSLLYKITAGMSIAQPPMPLFAETCQELRAVLGVRWVALQLSDAEPRLKTLEGRLLCAGDPPQDRSLLQQLGRDLLTAAKRNAPTLIWDEPAALSDTAAACARQLLSIPLGREGRPLGVLFAADRIDGEHFCSIDLKLCQSLATSLSIYLDNVLLFDDAHDLFRGTLHALTCAIDAKDTYTFGHSERVALLAQMLAERIKLDPLQVERIYLAGLVHDVGKIGVPEVVLCKDGRLTDAEFDIIKRHPSIGAEILRDIRPMQDLIPGVLHHHERWDGNGYPHQLAGEDIPLFGRILALADSFDAMSSNRTYRAALTPERVLDELRKCAGTQFDPTLAEAFLSLDLHPYRILIARHRQSKGNQAA